MTVTPFGAPTGHVKESSHSLPASVVSDRSCLVRSANDRDTHMFVDDTRREHKINGTENLGRAVRRVTQRDVGSRSVARLTDEERRRLKEEKLLEELGVDLSDTAKCVTAAQLENLQDWCAKQADVITKTGLLDPERVMRHDATMTIETVVEAPEFKARSPNTTRENKAEIMRQTEEKIEQGLIEPSKASTSSNCVVIRRDGKARIAVDYRKLNAVTKTDNYLLPRISEIFESLGGATWYTSVDATQAYHQIPLADERSKDLTSFVVPGGGLYRYKYMPFGLKNAGAMWSRFMDDTLGDLRWKNVICYADDILIFSKGGTLEEHLATVDEVFQRLRSRGIQVKGSKVKLAVKELSFLGQIVSVDGVKPDPKKIEAIASLQPPENVHQLRRLMGMFAYYRKYIAGYAQLAAPLYELCGKNAQNKRDAQQRIAFNNRQTEAFQALKRKLTTEPIMLRFPIEGAPFEVHCDASKVGIAAVLCQRVGGQERVVEYASRSLTKSERNYGASQRECLALVWSVDLFSHLLRQKHFTVRTDCESLTWLHKQKGGFTVSKWLLRLQEFDYTVVHRPGKKSANADGMTRQPLQGTNPFGEEPFEVLSMCSTCNVLTRTARRQQIEGEGEEPAEVITQAEQERNQANDELEGEEVSEESEWSEDGKQESAAKPMFKCEEDKEAWSDDAWLREQNRKDKEAANEYILSIKKGLNEGSEWHRKLFAEEGGFLIRKAKTRSEKSADSLALNRRVVPESLKAFIIGMHHNIEVAGHQGARRTLRLLTHRYYWPDMKADVRRWIRSCSACTRRKTPRPTRAGRTEITQAVRPWQTVGIDLLGPFPKSKSGNVWILTVVDHFTRWPIAVPLKDAESSTIAAALFDKVVTEHGVPEKILSDQGKNLVSQGIITLCKRWGAAKVQTGGYNPQANGSCERFHRYLNAAMAILQETKSKIEWDEICSSAVFSYRVSTNDATGYSPFFLAHGHNPRLPLDAVFSTETATFQNEEQYVVQISARLKSAFEQAKKLQFAAAKENQDRDPKTQEPLLKKGDFCYVWAPGAGQAKSAEGSAVPKKWRFPWKGPYEITEHLGRAGCRLKIGKKCKSYPHNRLHKHIPWSDSISTSSRWKLQEQPEAKGKDEAKEERAVSTKIVKGDVVVFIMKKTKDNPRPWGVGVVLNDKNQSNLEIQWLGNTRENANGKFEPCWFQDSEKAYYYGTSKIHYKHTPLTTWDTATTVGVADVILTSRTHIVLNNNNMMPSNTRKVVEDNYWVKTERRGFA